MSDEELNGANPLSLPSLTNIQKTLREKLVNDSGGPTYVHGIELTSIKMAAAEIGGTLGGDYTLIRQLIDAGATTSMLSSPEFLRSLANTKTLLDLAGEQEKAKQTGVILEAAATRFVTLQTQEPRNESASRFHTQRAASR